MKQQRKRSQIRILFGKIVYTALRYFSWYTAGTSFAKKMASTPLNYKVVSHQTPLFRKLQGLDMQLQYNKKRNLEIACGRINGILLHPGEVFSYWKLIGRPSRHKGYLPGLVLFYGNLRSGTAGGLCQLSNLIYWLTLHTPLTVSERYRHSYDVFPDSDRTQPFGSGATCVYPYRDLQITNTTSKTFQLTLEVSEKNLSGSWFADSPVGLKYQVYQKEHYITHEYWGAYVRHNTLYRKVYDSADRIVSDGFITENHALMMYEPFIPEK